jgi:hypothetical protein
LSPCVEVDRVDLAEQLRRLTRLTGFDRNFGCARLEGSRVSWTACSSALSITRDPGVGWVEKVRSSVAAASSSGLESEAA